MPKGAVYSHGNFSAQVDMLRQVYDIRPGEIDLPTFPLFALFAPALGMTSVVPEMDFTRPAAVDPAKIIAAIDKFGVTTMFGSPALINRVGRYGEAHGIKLPSLKRAISAGAPVPAALPAELGIHDLAALGKARGIPDTVEERPLHDRRNDEDEHDDRNHRQEAVEPAVEQVFADPADHPGGRRRWRLLGQHFTANKGDLFHLSAPSASRRCCRRSSPPKSEAKS